MDPFMLGMMVGMAIGVLSGAVGGIGIMAMCLLGPPREPVPPVPLKE